mgnify:FL=1
MEELIKRTEEHVIYKSNEYKANADDHYDFWNEHVKYVYFEAITLAEKYDADCVIVRLGALLHDIALIEKVGEREDHHNSKVLSDKVLDSFNCPSEVKERVLRCVYNHRSCKNATSIEELCVCDADVLAHFDNIPMLFNSAFNRNGLSLNDVRQWMTRCFEKDYSDLSDRTRESFKEKYELIKSIVINDEIARS